MTTKAELKAREVFARALAEIQRSIVQNYVPQTRWRISLSLLINNRKFKTKAKGIVPDRKSMPRSLIEKKILEFVSDEPRTKDEVLNALQHEFPRKQVYQAMESMCRRKLVLYVGQRRYSPN